MPEREPEYEMAGSTLLSGTVEIEMPLDSRNAHSVTECSLSTNSDTTTMPQVICQVIDTVLDLLNGGGSTFYY